MRKGIMALEGMEEAITPDLPLPDAELLVENELTELQAVTNAGGTLEAVQTEASDVKVTLDGIADQLQQGVDEGNGVSAPVAEALNAAVEHFKNRVSFTGRSGFVALEKFNTIDRLAAAKEGIAFNRAFSGKLDQALSIAQEGILDNLKDRFTLIFTSEDKLLKRLNETSRTYDSGTLKTEPLSGSGWGRHLSQRAKGAVSGKDVLDELKKIDDLINSADLSSSVNSLTLCVVSLSAAVHKSNLYSSKKEIDRIESEHADIVQLQARVEKEISGAGKGGNTASFEPLEKAEKGAMTSLLKKMLSSGKLQKDCDKLEEALKQLGRHVLVNRDLRLAGLAAEDLRKALSASRDAQRALNIVSDLISARVKLCHAAVSYMAASTGDK